MRKLGLSLLCFGAMGALWAEGPTSGACKEARAQARIVRDGEPGERLSVLGQVFRPDGVTPAAGVIVYAYQTGKDGLYGPQGNSAPRLRGWMKTDAQGRFRLETIRPGSYPNTRIAAHIHFQAWGAGTPVQYTEEMLFEDDPLVLEGVKARSRQMGEFGFVQKVVNGEATIRLRLKAQGDRMEENILHGVRECGG